MKLLCVAKCNEVCYSPCPFRISPQRAEAIKNLGIVHNSVDNVCNVCHRTFIKAKRDGKSILVCACRID